LFQQVTENVLAVKPDRLQPKATLLQFGYCLLLYNLMQLIKNLRRERRKCAGERGVDVLPFQRREKGTVGGAYHTNGAGPARGAILNK